MLVPVTGREKTLAADGHASPHDAGRFGER